MWCFFDRNPDGTIHLKAFAGRSFDRTIHCGDLTGIEIMTRLMKQVFSRSIPTLEDHQAIELLPTLERRWRGQSPLRRHTPRDIPRGVG